MLQQFRDGQFARLFSDGVEADALASPAERRRRRAALMRESGGRTFGRLCADLNHMLNPRALLALPGAVDFVVREKSIGVADLPDPRSARRTPDGLAGLAHDLSAPTVAEAYSRGLFLRWMLGQASYWSPSERFLARPADIASDENCGHLFDSSRFQVTLDRDFDAIVGAATAEAVRRRLPYLPSTPGMMAFGALHDAGFAHSVEIRDRAGALAGGLYGVACGRVFTIQTRFGSTPQAADLAVAALARHLEAWGFDLIDGCSDATLISLGFGATPRSEYLAQLPPSLTGGRPGRWLVSPGLIESDQAERVITAI